MTIEPELIGAYIAQTLTGKLIEGSSIPPFTVSVAPHTRKNIDLVAITINSSAGFYSFTNIPAASLSANGSLQVREAWRGHGIGRALVETREAACAQLGIRTIVIGENANDRFWAQLGYEPVQDVERYRALARDGLIRYRERCEELGLPLMKRL